MSQPRIGDIIEIVTSKGLAYAIYTHKHKMYGALIRLFDKLFETRPENINTLLGVQVRFSTFIPLAAALEQDIFEVVGNLEVPEQLKDFPTFRAGAVDPRTKKVSLWWFWDGEKEWQVGDLTNEQRRMSIRGVWNDTLLIERIESGWSPETDPI